MPAREWIDGYVGPDGPSKQTHRRNSEELWLARPNTRQQAERTCFRRTLMKWLYATGMILGIGSFGVASAAGPMTWRAELVQWQGTPNEKDYWTTQSYPTKAAALAAMYTLAGANEIQVTSYLTQEVAITGMGFNSVTYYYVAPVIYPPITTSYQWGSPLGAHPGPYPDEASAVAEYDSVWCNILKPYTTCNTAPTTAWTRQSPPPSGGPPEPYDAEDSRGYKVTALPSGLWESDSLLLKRAYSCPVGYGLHWSDPTVHPFCTSTEFVGYVIGSRLLDCPANGGPSSQVGDPCDVSTGDFSQTEPDYASAGLNFTRYYHSGVLESHHTLGVGWTHSYAGYLVISGPLVEGMVRPDGHHDAIEKVNGEWVTLSGNGVHIQQSGSNWVAYYGDGSSELYNATGQLIQLVSAAGQITSLAYNAGLLASVTGPFGHTLQFAYDSSSRLQTVTEPDGTSTITYAYDSHNNLVSATYPDSSFRQYQYQQSNFPNNLTGIIDESNKQFASVNYDATSGGVTSSQQAGGAQAVSIAYSPSTATVTDSLGASHVYTFTQTGVYAPRVSSVTYNTLSQSYSVAPPTSDPQQRVTQVTDANGDITQYTYDTDHLLSKTEAYGTAVARTTSYPQYLSTNTSLPVQIDETLKQTTYAYWPGTNNVQTKTVTDTSVTPNVARVWSYTYDTYGRMLTAKGPRTDVNSTTTYTYYTCSTGYQCGRLNTVTDPVGNVTTYNTYNAHGLPTQITDPNGVVTTLAYDPRLRLTDRCSNGSLPACSGGDLTHFDYYPTGLLKKVTLPDSSYILYTYDNAHRLTQISDGAGNSIQYTLDNMGNHIAEKTYDPSSVLHHAHTRVYNTLNELHQDVNAAGTSAVTTTYGYDNNGNQTTINAPVSRNTTNVYDPLNRLSQITDPANGNTYFGYDGENNLTSVKDPRSLTTNYTYNGFGDLTKLVSPDTGTTTNTYDSGGNLATATDARNAVASYAYDKANRVTSITYKYNGVADQTIAFGYDTGTNGKGRLTSASDANHALSWTYDTQGRVTGKGLTIGSIHKSVGYGYTNADLTSLVTPSNQSVTYGYNTNHQVTSIKVNGTIVLSGVSYEPFGGVNGWTWGNGTTVSRSYNEDGLVSKIVTAGVTLGYSFDNANRISGITDSSNSALSWTYGYDLLDRLNSAKTSSITDGWTYDANGNRLTQTGTTPITFTVSSSSNQLDATTGSLLRSYTYDAAGNTKEYGPNAFTYNNHGRMKSTSASSTAYLYSAMGQMIEKSGTLGTTIFMRDEAGHLIGEYDGTGKLIEETIWLGDIPIATLRPNGSGVSIFYVHTDHLNTPRKVAQSTSGGQLVWRWDADPFGTTTPNQNPAGLGTFVYGLRFPGQYYMTETGLNQNWNRDYDPLTGKYIESDPIGLKGGINTYAYVGETPLIRTDPRGLVAWSGTYYTWGTGLIAYQASHYTFTLFSACVNHRQMGIKVSATAFGYGVGLLPWSNTGGSVSFEDGQSDLNPNVFTGTFEVTTITATSPIGYSWSSYRLGQAKSPFSGGAAAGVDVSASVETGDAHITTKIGPFCCSN